MDFFTSEDAIRAAKNIDGRQAWGVKIRVKIAKGSGSSKPGEREAWDEGGSSSWEGATEPAN